GKRVEAPSVITYRANMQDTEISSFPFTDIEKWLWTDPRKPEQKVRFARAMVFLDVCHAGQAATLKLPRQAETLLLLATNQEMNKKPVAYEDTAFSDGVSKGHGAFTYFLLRKLNTREVSSGFLTAGDLIDFVSHNVYQATKKLDPPQ